MWGKHRDAPWAELLHYWGLPSLQMINRDVHVAKCATEARGRHLLATGHQKSPDRLTARYAFRF
jgi:hypothetical protein